MNGKHYCKRCDLRLDFHPEPCPDCQPIITFITRRFTWLRRLVYYTD